MLRWRMDTHLGPELSMTDVMDSSRFFMKAREACSRCVGWGKRVGAWGGWVCVCLCLYLRYFRIAA
jgi:hypothetical protein